MSQKRAKKGQKALNLTLAPVTSLVGCVTVVITIAALLLGLWLDAQFGTRPLYTVVITIASLPVTLITVFVVTRWTTSRMLFGDDQEKENSED